MLGGGAIMTFVKSPLDKGEDNSKLEPKNFISIVTQKVVCLVKSGFYRMLSLFRQEV